MEKSNSTVWPRTRNFIAGYFSGMALVLTGHPFDTVLPVLQARGKLNESPPPPVLSSKDKSAPTNGRTQWQVQGSHSLPHSNLTSGRGTIVTADPFVPHHLSAGSWTLQRSNSAAVCYRDYQLRALWATRIDHQLYPSRSHPPPDCV